ncbi:MAG: purine-nucleoside phosphorylase [Planctomycetes bacterium]|nr:purine-nucleoside phosphorylase [Planctomycetota bacterium]
MRDQVLPKIEQAVAAIRARTDFVPELGIVLGSGLGGLVDRLEGALAIPYAEIPNWPVPTVKGHAGALVLGRLGGKHVAALAGRSHLYEGCDISETAFPVRVLGRLGIRTLLVTNSAGSATKELNPGDLMLIVDHINLLGMNPLRGPNVDELGTRFPDMSAAYDRDLAKLAERVAGEEGIPLKPGVYLATPGPSYETPAEVRMMRLLGADAVGMSSVPEVIAARHMGLRVLGVSCITNLAAGISDQALSHEEVIETGRRTAEKFQRLIERIVRAL